jgi:hypothetical protein
MKGDAAIASMAIRLSSPARYENGGAIVHKKFATLTGFEPVLPP